VTTRKYVFIGSKTVSRSDGRILIVNHRFYVFSQIFPHRFTRVWDVIFAIYGYALNLLLKTRSWLGYMQITWHFEDMLALKWRAGYGNIFQPYSMTFEGDIHQTRVKNSSFGNLKLSIEPDSIHFICLLFRRACQDPVPTRGCDLSIYRY
jgi:hypothetical protein